MAEKTLTGFDRAVVNVETKLGNRVERSTMSVRKGESLPSNLADGEMERLEAMGAFESQTRSEKVRAARRPMAVVGSASPNGPDGSENRPETASFPVMAPTRTDRPQRAGVNIIDAANETADESGTDGKKSSAKK